ncbi:MAG: AAA family ATPase [Roseburia sp.]|nr:AAA family ATPase [Roseburia sp.]
MQIREADIYHFGKLQEKKIRFAPGINVVYGANEAGKTTLHAFITAMLFGLEKNRGRAKSTDGYLRYEPWHAPAYYSGALRFAVDGRYFYLERSFYHREKREILRNEEDGEELSVAYGDLAVLLGGIDKETYGNTYDIPQSGAATGQELGKLLAEYLTDVSEGGSASIHVTQALELLERKRKELNADLKTIQEEKKREEQALATERELLEQDCLRLRSELAAETELARGEDSGQQLAQAELARGEDSGQQSEQTELARGQDSGQQLAQASEARESVGHSRKERKSGASDETYRVTRMAAYWGIVLLLAAMLVIGLLYGQALLPAFGFGIAEAGLGVAAGVLLFLAGRRRGRDERQEAAKKQSEEAERTERPGEEAQSAEKQREEAENARKQSERLLLRMQDSLAEKETRLYNITERLEALKIPGERERELLMELEAASMAKEEIKALAQEFGEEQKDALNSEVSRYVSAVTGGRYDSVRIDENGGLRVLTEGKEVPPEALSRGTLEQFYLAFRIAVGNIVMKEETMPLLLDETFSMYDDERLAQTLRMISGLGNQVILFTCQRREMDLLEEAGIPYHRIEMEV